MSGLSLREPLVLQVQSDYLQPEGSVDRERFSILLRLSERPPAAQQLREAVWAIAASGCETLFVDWNRSFPWSVGEQFRSEATYREELVPGLYREAIARGMSFACVFPAADELHYIGLLEGYRRFFHSRQGHLIVDLSSGAGRSFMRKLVEDYVALLPEAETLMVNWRVASLVESEMELFGELFQSCGARLLLRPLGASPGSFRMVGWVPYLDGVVLPAEWPVAEEDAGKWVFREHLLPDGLRSHGLGVHGELAGQLAEVIAGAGELSLLLPEHSDA